MKPNPAVARATRLRACTEGLLRSRPTRRAGPLPPGRLPTAPEDRPSRDGTSSKRGRQGAHDRLGPRYGPTSRASASRRARRPAWARSSRLMALR